MVQREPLGRPSPGGPSAATESGASGARDSSRRLAIAQRDNSSTASRWSEYTSHRRAVAVLVAHFGNQHRASRAGGRIRLSVLGAGNGNDLAFDDIVRPGDEVHLVDLDGQALARAAAKFPDYASLTLHGGVDLMETEDLRSPPAQLVLSTAVLSQVFLSDLGPRVDSNRIRQIRHHHLRVVLGATAVGGQALLVNDLVSSRTAPEIEVTPASELSALMTDLIARRNFFSGCNPYAICGQLETDWNYRARDITLHPPWTWQIGRNDVRLVYAISFRRGLDTDP